jgi:Flp pilus assembly protein TadB
VNVGIFLLFLSHVKYNFLSREKSKKVEKSQEKSRKVKKSGVKPRQVKVDKSRKKSEKVEKSEEKWRKESEEKSRKVEKKSSKAGNVKEKSRQFATFSFLFVPQQNVIIMSCVNILMIHFVLARKK